MVTPVRRIVIWAHSECRSTAALFLETRRLAASRGIDVEFCLWGRTEHGEGRRMELPGATRVGDDFEKGLSVLRARGGFGTVQVFCVYQNSAVWRRLIVAAKAGGARVVVYAEAPCEMCLGWKALLKRIYYRYVLPRRVRRAVEASDLFISQSGEMGRDRLLRLGWPDGQIAPFGYRSPRLTAEAPAAARENGGKRALRILHLGSEAPYRGLAVLAAARTRLASEGVATELVKSGGALSPAELVAAIRSADAVVACGLCEPWGMRINDALAEGTPVVVSDGMGVESVCREYGCGLVTKRGDAASLAAALRRLATDSELRANLRAGAARAAEALEPAASAKRFLALVCGDERPAARPKRILHVSAGWQRWNGAAVVARKIAAEQRAAGAVTEIASWAGIGKLRSADEVWIHCGWMPQLWWAAWWAKTAVWMSHGCCDPVRRRYHGWKKVLVGPVERWAMRRADRIVATCGAEVGWIRGYLGSRCPRVEMTDLRRFFGRTQPVVRERPGEPRHLLYLGRRHPLKGLEYLEEAVAEVNRVRPCCELAIVSDAFGQRKNRVWEWCDTLVLPSLSENFGLVVAEALERGKRVIVTDGAPAWSDLAPEQGVYLRGYREGTPAERVRLLRSALV